MVVILILLSLIGTTLSQTNCQYTDTSGNFYDLKPLSNPTSDYVIDWNTNGKIYTNLCRPTLQKMCGTDVAACQVINAYFSLGKASTLQFSVGTQFSGEQGLIANFVDGTPSGGIPRAMQIDFICNTTAGVGSPTFLVEPFPLQYYFTWDSAYACAAKLPKVV